MTHTEALPQCYLSAQYARSRAKVLSIVFAILAALVGYYWHAAAANIVWFALIGALSGALLVAVPYWLYAGWWRLTFWYRLDVLPTYKRRNGRNMIDTQEKDIDPKLYKIAVHLIHVKKAEEHYRADLETLMEVTDTEDEREALRHHFYPLIAVASTSGENLEKIFAATSEKAEYYGYKVADVPEGYLSFPAVRYQSDDEGQEPTTHSAKYLEYYRSL